MAKVSKRQLLEAVAGGAGLEHAEVGKDQLVAGDGAVRHAVTVAGDRHDPSLLTWTVHAIAAELDPLLPKFGGMRVEIWRPDRTRRIDGVVAPAGYRYPWPANKTELQGSTFMDDIRRYLPAAMSFVADRRDFGEILLADGDVHRGEVWANLPPNARPGRVAKALVLARRTGDTELERRTLDVLDRDGARDISWEPGRAYLFRDAVRDWAKKFASPAQVDLSDVTGARSRP
jgi:hypothetical protein